jgi:hypothetical protein
MDHPTQTLAPLRRGDPVSLEGEATMADYHYVSTWQLQAPIEQVWADEL